MFSVGRFFKISFGGKKQQQPLQQQNVPVAVAVADAERKFLPAPATAAKPQPVSQQDENAIADLLFQDMSRTLKNREEQVNILTTDVENLRKEVADLMSKNLELHAENARLQDLVKGVCGSYSKLDSSCNNNSQVLKSITGYSC